MIPNKSKMIIKLTFVVVTLLFLLNTVFGCAYHDRLERLKKERAKKQRLALLRSESALERAREHEIHRAQEQAIRDVKDNIGYPSHTYHRKVTRVQPLVSGTNYRYSNLPAGAHLCAPNSLYFCHAGWSCVSTGYGAYKCTKEQKVSRYVQSGESYYPQGGQRTTRVYYPQPQRGGSTRVRPIHQSRYTPYYRSVCPTGTTRVNVTENSARCVDIDECETGEHKCDMLCHNYYGTYSCSCTTGFKRATKYECEDINECELFANCEYQCLNTNGSYECLCPNGTEKHGDKCRDINECETESPCGEDETCFNTMGDYECDPPYECPEGYQEVTDGCQNADQEIMSFMKVGTKARKYYNNVTPLASVSFTTRFPAYFFVQVLEGGNKFWQRRTPDASQRSQRLDIEVFNWGKLAAGERLPYIFKVTAKRPYREYWYSQTDAYVTRIFNMTIVPMELGHNSH